MTRKEQLEFCSVCTNRIFDPKQGIICGLTNQIATFQESCDDFNRDNTVQETAKTTEFYGEEIVANVDDVVLEKIVSHQNFPFALVSGLLAAIIGAILWATITVVTKLQIGYMAIGIGVLVGFMVRYFGLGIDKKFGILGGFLALFGCLLGNFLSQIGFYAISINTSFINALKIVEISQIPAVIYDSFQIMDVFFYGIAISAGYRFSFRILTSEAINDLSVREERYNKSLRLKKVLMGAVLVALFGLFLFVKYGKADEAQFSYDTGEIMSKGALKNGKKEGKWTSFYKNGNKESIGYYNNDIPESKWIWFSEEGGVISKGNYNNGVEQGTWINYYSNGVVMDSGHYHEGRMNGLWILNYENGQLKQIGNYIRNYQEGEWKSYYENGNLISKGTMTKSEMTNTWLFYYENGNKWQEIAFSPKQKIINMWTTDGKQLVLNGNGNVEERNNEGKLLSQGTVKEGIKIGNWKYYYSNEKLKEEIFYEGDLAIITNFWDIEGNQLITNGNGKYISYYDESKNVFETGMIVNGKRDGYWEGSYDLKGIVLKHMQYKKGKLNGPCTIFHQNGEVQSEGEFKEDKKEGLWNWYYASGQLSSTVNYVKDKKQGTQALFNEVGLKIKEETYVNDILTKEIDLQ